MSGVYISYPFCGQKCTYCNFASGVFSREWEARYPEAVRAEAAAMDWPWIPETVYLGGGTPSRAEASDLAELLAGVPGRPWAEATMEAAPGELSSEKIREWVDAGINRVSLGVQSFVEGELRRTGRRHTAEIVAEEIARLRSAGLENFNLDLIAGLPGQTRESWEESLEWIERLAPPHVSVYMLEVDEDSRLGREKLEGGTRYGAADVPDDGMIVELYEAARERLARIGIPRYEISNFARPGWESRHNLKYWLWEPYVGLGADAHSFSGAMRWWNAESAGAYLGLWKQGKPVRADEAEAIPEERILTGLRLERGVALTEAEQQRYADAIAFFERQGLLCWTGGRLRLTDQGVLVANEVMAAFLPDPALAEPQAGSLNYCEAVRLTIRTL